MLDLKHLSTWGQRNFDLFPFFFTLYIVSVHSKTKITTAFPLFRSPCPSKSYFPLFLSFALISINSATLFLFWVAQYFILVCISLVPKGHTLKKSPIFTIASLHFLTHVFSLLPYRPKPSPDSRWNLICHIQLDWLSASCFNTDSVFSLTIIVWINFNKLLIAPKRKKEATRLAIT